MVPRVVDSLGEEEARIIMKSKNQEMKGELQELNEDNKAV